jgi:methylated-DNA-protein-cysteine methyltransferase-like protein
MAIPGIDTAITIIQNIPRGRVMFYSQIGQMAGLTNGARQVPYILRKYAQQLNLPWQRVVRKNRTVADAPGHNAALQKRLLQAEGVEFNPQGVIPERYVVGSENS